MFNNDKIVHFHVFTGTAINFFLLVFHSETGNVRGKKTDHFMNITFITFFNSKDILTNF